MAIPDFNSTVKLQRIPAPSDDPALLNELLNETAEGQLGNLVDWITSTVSTQLRPYHRIVLTSGHHLDHAAIAELAETAEFKAWKDAAV